MSEMVEFERLVDRRGPDECWPWTGRLQENRSGDLYGYFKRGLRANRVAYRLYCGAIPAGMVVRHRCDNTVCVNPAHLETGTQKQNVDDRYERGRANHVRGSNHGISKLTEADIPLIRGMLQNGMSRRVIAAEFGVSQFPINEIANGRAWTHV
jgi:hypothetical protein